MSYDPEQDPRYIPDPIAEIASRLFDAAKLETIEGLQSAVDRCDAMQVMFDTEGWAILTQMVAREADSLDEALKRELERAQWMLLRGQKIQADFFLQIPGRIYEQRARAESTIVELTSTEGSE